MSDVSRLLTHTHPDLALQWHPTKNGEESIDALTKSSKKKVWWLGDCGHEWEALVRNRAMLGSGCPFCAGRKILAGFNDLGTTHPDLAGELAIDLNDAGMRPDSISAGANKKVWWRCHQGHEWQATVNNRSGNGTGCPVCAETVLVVGVNDLATKRPHLIPLWHPTKNGITPSEVRFSSHDKTLWWMCSQGHEWQNSPNAMASVNHGCAICDSKKSLAGFNDLFTTHPEIASEWHPTKNGSMLASDVVYGSHRTVWWQCAQGHEWRASVQYRASRNSQCPVCAHREVQTGFNDLVTLHPDLASEWSRSKNEGVAPESTLPTSQLVVWWDCQHGHEWQAPVNKRVRGNANCPTCVHHASFEKDLLTLHPDPDAKTFVSTAAREIGDVLRSWGLDIRTSVRDVLPQKELDIYLPQQNFAIEFNGLYWHSERHKDKNYHWEKSNACEEKGIYLYQIWEDDWRLRKEVVLRGIAHRLGLSDKISELFSIDPAYSQRIFARKTLPVEVETQQAKDFLEENHIQGFTSGSKYYALVDDVEAIRALLVVKKKTHGSSTWTIERYATKGNIVGGFTKLLKFAEKENSDVQEWITFSDRTISDGKLYEQTGFVKDKIIPPDYSYLVGSERKHKFSYRLARFKADPELLWAEGLTERELAQMNGLYRIWDSGKIRWKKTI